MELKVSLLLLVSLVNTSMGLMLVLRDAQRAINRWFALMALSCATWVAGIAGFYLANASGAEIAWAKFFYVAPLLLVASSVIVADLFPNGQGVRRSKLWFMAAGLLLIGLPLLFVRSFLTEGIVHHPWGNQVVLGKPEYLVYSAYIVCGFAWMLGGLAHQIKTLRGIYKLQAKVFFYGSCTSAIFGTCFNLFLPWFGNYRLIWVGPLATTFYVATTLYSIVRHRLFDIQLVIARSLAYLLSIVVLGMAYGFAAFTIITYVLGAPVPSIKQRALSTALAVVIAVTFPVVKRFFDRITNRLFYRDAYDPQSFIDALNKVLVVNTELEEMLENAAQVVVSNIKAEYCLFGIKETKFKGQRVIGTIKDKKFPVHDIAQVRAITPHLQHAIIIADDLEDEPRLSRLLDKNNIAVLIRLTASIAREQEGIGYMLLGVKRSGNMYGSQDIKMLDIVSKEISIAIQNALHFEEIENFNVTLEHRVEEATRKLRRTNDKLKLLDETKDDFISMASHQLRTPLTSVKGYVSMVLDGDAGKVNGMQRRLLNQSYISAQRMVYLISDLLNVSRLRTGKFVIEPIATNLARVVKDEVDQLQETAKGRNLNLTFDRPEHFPALMLDETKIRQVVMNFIDNAIYYTPSGGHIHVSLVEKPQTIEFTVQDDGIGVPKHEQHHLFSKFYRAENAKRARPDGTGLGLFMAKKVVIAQGGAIIFKSQQHKGSTFGFSFAKSRLLPDNPTVVSADTTRR